MSFAIEERFVYFARELAAKAHEGQVDKLGAPYFDHLEAVAQMCRNEWPEGDAFKVHGVIVAYLHDIVEDTEITLDGLARYFPKSIVKAVDAITHRPNEQRKLYYERCKANWISKHVKRFDVRHNQSRLHLIPDEETRNRLMFKYLEAEIALDDVEMSDEQSLQ